MSQLLLEGISTERAHSEHLQRQVLSCRKIRIATPYVTDQELLLKGAACTQLLTSLSDNNLASGATSIDSVRALIEGGVECRSLDCGKPLHAKVYLFDDERAVVTSANLTSAGLNRNIEAGVRIDGDVVGELVSWYQQLWSISTPISLRELDRRAAHISEMRAQFQALQIALKKRSAPRPGGPSRSLVPLDRLVSSEAKYFLCNSNRANDKRDVSGFLLEERMLFHGFAVAWETFNYPIHMEHANVHDVVFLYAKGCGIVAVGKVIGSLEKLKTDEAGALGHGAVDDGVVEWRLPVEWLARFDDVDACPVSSLNSTFQEISGPIHAQRRNAVLTHFSEGTK